MQRPLRPCARPGCSTLVRPPEKYCPKHKQEAEFQSKERNKLYDEQEREPKLVEFYHSREWEALRQYVLAKDAYLCQPCLREHRITRADTVHHIVPIKQDWSRRLDPSNLEAICRACHNRLHDGGG